MTDKKNLESNYHNNHGSNLKKEITLFELVVQLWLGKKIILIFLIVAVVLAILYNHFSAEKWTSTATVTLPAAGQVANYNAALSVVYSDTPQDKPSLSNLQNQLFNRFSASLSALSNSLKNLQDPLVFRVTPVTGSNDSFDVSFQAPTAKEAQAQLSNYINDTNDQVVNDYGDDIKRNLSVKTRELTNTLDTLKQVAIDKKEHRIAVIQQALKIAQATTVNKLQVNQAEFLSDDTLYLLGSDALNAMVNNEATKPLDYTKDYYEAQRALLAVTHLKVEVDNLQSYRYISQADLPIRRDSPKKAIIILLSLILGGLIGSIIVLGRNAVTAYRSRN